MGSVSMLSNATDDGQQTGENALSVRFGGPMLTKNGLVKVRVALWSHTRARGGDLLNERMP